MTIIKKVSLRHSPAAVAGSEYYPEGKFAAVVIATLLHVYCAPSALPTNDAVAKARRTLCYHDLAIIVAKPREGYDHDMELTARGNAYVRMLLAMPLPVLAEVWTHPLTHEELKP